MPIKLKIDPDSYYTWKECCKMFQRELTNKRYFSHIRTMGEWILLNNQRGVKRYKKYIVKGIELYKIIGKLMPKLLPHITIDHARYK